MQENFLILGVALIVAAVALGLIAYAVVLNRREAEKTGEGDASPAETEPEPGPSAEPARSEVPAPAAAPPVPPAPAASQPPAPAPAARPSLPPGPPAATARPLATPVAVIMREDASGRYFLRMGERELRRPEDIRDANDQRLVDGLLAQLGKIAVRPQRAAGKPAAAEGYAEGPSRPLSMVEQINAIVERKLSGLPGSKRAVRLVEGPAGSVRVYIGVNRYDTIDQVPDPEILRIIREAVAEWEAKA